MTKADKMLKDQGFDLIEEEVDNQVYIDFESAVERRLIFHDKTFLYVEMRYTDGDRYMVETVGEIDIHLTRAILEKLEEIENDV